ncbi:MAG: hypothetical protein ABEI96_08705 [Haloarculaceae archaeon]
MPGPSSDDDTILGESPREPEEFDPDSLGPSVDVPQAPDPTETDATLDPGVRVLFWKLVATFDLALFALALGPTLVYSRDRLLIGGAVFAIGALAFGYGYRTYRRYRAGEIPERDFDNDDSGDLDHGDGNDYGHDRNG